MAEVLKVWESQYDLVLLDSPPVLLVTDSVVLSSMVNSVLLMVRHQKTPLSALERSYRMLEEVHSASGRKINIVINAVKEQPVEGSIFYEHREREAAKA
jgi:Mrp family chromosome partitioning ATPase